MKAFKKYTIQGELCNFEKKSSECESGIFSS